MQNNAEQEKFIKSDLSNKKLLGIPGGGKTKTIIDKIVHHHETKELLNSSYFIVLTFSRCAKQDFLKKAKKSHDKLFTNTNIRTIHSLSGAFVKKMLDRNSSSIETVVKCANDILKKENCEDIRTLKMFKNIKCVFVDEAQDLTELYYDFLVNLHSKLGCGLILIGDPNQNIYQFNNGSDKYLMKHEGDTHILTRNYRSDRKIVEFINHMRPWKTLLPDMVSNSKKDGKIPTVFKGSIEDIKIDILHEIQKYKGNLNEIAVIGPVKRSKPSGKTYVNIGLSLILNWFQEHGIKYVQHYNHEINGVEEDSRSYTVEDNHINILTCHGSKGLEFNKVILLNFHHATFGRIPSEEDHNKFNYLWYVGVSRAKNDLKMYVSEDRTINYNIFDCPKNTYKSNLPIKKCTPLFKEDEKVLFHSVKDVLSNKKIFDEYVFDYFEKSFDMESYKTEQLYEVDSKTSDYYDDYSAFCGMFFENIFFYFCKENREEFEKLVLNKLKYFNKLIEVPRRYKQCVVDLQLHIFECTTLSVISNYKNRSNLWKSFYEYLLKILESDFNREFGFYLKNDVQDTDFKKVKSALDTLLVCERDEAVKKIADICMFEYQFELEIKKVVDKFSIEKFIEDFDVWIKCIGKYASGIKTKYQFQNRNKHPYLNIKGVTDIIDIDRNIIELKFVNKLTVKHVIQVILYHNNVNYDWTKCINFSIINLKSGEKRTYRIKPNVTNYKFNLKLCKILETKFKNPVVFYDLEVNTKDVLDAIKSGDIIERHCEDYVTGWIVSEGLIKSKKRIYKEIENLTGITNKMVSRKNVDKSINNFKKDMRTFIENSIDPIFVAHNGNSFDHKIMRTKKIFTEEDNIYLLDSKMIMRMITPEDVHNFKLGEIYSCVVGEEMKNAHRARADVLMMKHIFDKLGFGYSGFMGLINKSSSYKKENMVDRFDKTCIDIRIKALKSKKSFSKTDRKYEMVLERQRYGLEEN